MLQAVHMGLSFSQGLVQVVTLLCEFLVQASLSMGCLPPIVPVQHGASSYVWGTAGW